MRRDNTYHANGIKNKNPLNQQAFVLVGRTGLEPVTSAV